MNTAAHLWAVGYDNTERAAQVRDEIAKLAWGPGQAGRYLVLFDLVVVVRHADGSYSLDREPFPEVVNILGCGLAGFLAGLVLGAPLTGAAVGALVGGAGTATAAHLGINKDFIRDVEALMRPGSSALFVWDDEGDLETILHAIRGQGGTVLKTNVDAERAKLVQSTLATAAGGPSGSRTGRY
jgi:uncharacterized membrane protein